MLQKLSSRKIGGGGDREVAEEDEGEDQRLCAVALGLLTTLLEMGEEKRADEEEAELRAMLKSLEILSGSRIPEVAELATTVRASILTRDLTLEQKKEERDMFLRSKEADGLQEAIKAAREDLDSDVVPLKARGVVMVTRLVRTASFNQVEPKAAEEIFEAFVSMAGHDESYVYLAAAQGLSVLADRVPALIIPRLVQLVVREERGLTIAHRLKLAEAVMFAARKCGEAMPKYGKYFVSCFVSGARKRAGSVVSDAQDEVDFRCSCLSNLAEVCELLHWSLRPYATDVTDLVCSILEMEDVAGVRRGSAFVITRIIAGCGADLPRIVHDMTRIRNVLKNAANRDVDDVVRFHAQKALGLIDDIMYSQLGIGIRL